jgi:hypothetical protein
LDTPITHQELTIDGGGHDELAFNSKIMQPTYVKVSFITLSPYPKKNQNFSLLQDYPVAEETMKKV